MNAHECRTLLHESITAAAPFESPEDTDEDLPDGGVVTGWVMIAEWQGTDGNRWLSKISSDASGQKALPNWTTRGLCSEVVHNWPDGD